MMCNHPFFFVLCLSPILQEIREKYERALAMSPELMPWAQGLISKAPTAPSVDVCHGKSMGERMHDSLESWLPSGK
jgi:hypothetical protein